MDYQKKEWPALSTVAEISSFSSVKGVQEYHVIVRLTDVKQDVSEQFKQIETTIKFVQNDVQNAVLVWKRYFVSDAINQHIFIKSDQNAAVSIVQQPPLNGTKVAVWLYFVTEVHVTNDNQGTIMERSSYRHLFHTQLYSPGTDETLQTGSLFKYYIQLLATEGCTMEKHCLRTWVFVQNVDTYYKGMVAARRECYEQEGLTPETHFIASTGIEGKYIRPEVLVFMDAYAVQGLKPEQIQYLYAPTHFCPTCRYGVTFERGTAIHYGDRRHVFISGTASINNRGEIENPMNIIKQTDRMFENIRTLLAEAGTDMNDVAHLIVYLRDIADYETIASYMKQNYPQIPQVIVWAPVCRPGWLVEAECMAIKEVEDRRFEDF
jgi:enamine deaminase RidA (YjgF/YER057c/UK114 family)